MVYTGSAAHLNAMKPPRASDRTEVKPNLATYARSHGFHGLRNIRNATASRLSGRLHLANLQAQ